MRVLIIGHGPGTSCVNKVGDPDLAGQLRRAERLTVLIGELERWHCAVSRDGPLLKRLDFDVSQPEQHGQSNKRDQHEHDFPRRRCAGHGARFIVADAVFMIWLGQMRLQKQRQINNRRDEQRAAAATVRSRKKRIARATNTPPSISSIGR